MNNLSLIAFLIILAAPCSSGQIYQNLSLGLVIPGLGDVGVQDQGNQWLLGVSLNISDLVIKQVNEIYAHPANLHFNLIHYDSKFNKLGTTSAVIQSALDGVLGVVGEWNSGNTLPAAYAAMSYSKLFCTGTATSDVFSNKDLFPLFYRTLPADSFQGTFIARYCTYMGWTTINIVTGTDSYSSSIYAAFWAKAFALGITSAQIQVADSVTFLAADYRRLVNQLSSSTSRVILCLSGPTIIQQVMRAATTAGFGKSWVWVGGDGMGSYLSQVPHLSAQEQAFAEGTLAVFAAESAPGTYRYEQLLAEYSSIYGASHASDVSHSAFALFTGACLETMVYGWVQIARQYGVANILNGSYRPRLADFTTPLITVTGATSFLPTGDRDGLYVVLNLQNGTTVPVYQGDPSGVIVQKATPMFPDGTSTPPDWRPSYSLIYPDPTTPGVIAILALSGIMAICIIVSWAWMVLYRKTRRMRHLGLSFLTTLCVGLLALLSIPVWRAAVPTPTRCAGEVSALFLGFSLSLSSIYIRSFRIFKIFDNRIVSKVWSTSTRALVARMLAIPLIQAALLAIQQTTSPIALVELRTITTLSYMCDLGSFATLSGLAWNLSVLLNLLLLLLLGWTSFRIRHIQASYQDTQWLVYAIQHIFIAGIVAALLVGIYSTSPMLLFYAESACILYGVFSIYVTMVFRHVIALASTSGPEMSKSTAMMTDIFSVVSDAFGQGASTPLLATSQRRSYTGIFPIKRVKGLLAQWRNMELTVMLDLGYIGIFDPNMTGAGHMYEGSQCTVTHGDGSDFPMCILLHIPLSSKSPLAIQCAKAGELAHWTHLLSLTCGTSESTPSSGTGMGGALPSISSGIASLADSAPVSGSHSTNSTLLRVTASPRTRSSISGPSVLKGVSEIPEGKGS